MATETAAGFIALVGEPNTGKSTLLNRLVGSRIAPVTHKAQTTRFRIRGIAVEGNAQLVFVDTPGLFDPKNRLDRAMVATAWSSAAEADAILLLVPANQPVSARTLDIVDALEHRRRPEQKLVLTLNKTDLDSGASLLAATRCLSDRIRFDEVFMISALRNDGVDDIRAWLAGNVPAGPWLFPPDQLSDSPKQVIAAEITRSKLMLRLHEEIPYRLTVATERWMTRKDGSVHVDQVVHVERNSHKGMVVGKGGQAIRQVSIMAREDIAAFLGQDVHLVLRVKVRPNWINDVSLDLETGG